MCLKEEVKRLRRGGLSKGVLLLQENSWVHNAEWPVDTADQCKFEILPDLAVLVFFYLNSQYTLNLLAFFNDSPCENGYLLKGIDWRILQYDCFIA